MTKPILITDPGYGGRDLGEVNSWRYNRLFGEVISDPRAEKKLTRWKPSLLFFVEKEGKRKEM